MSVTITKPKAKEVSKYDASLIVLPETVDEYASKKAKLDSKMEKLSPLAKEVSACLLYTSPSPRDRQRSRMPSSA